MLRCTCNFDKRHTFLTQSSQSLFTAEALRRGVKSATDSQIF